MEIDLFGIKLGQPKKNRQPNIKEYHIPQKELLQALNLNEETIQIIWNQTYNTLIIKTQQKKTINQRGYQNEQD